MSFKFHSGLPMSIPSTQGLKTSDLMGRTPHGPGPLQAGHQRTQAPARTQQTSVQRMSEREKIAEMVTRSVKLMPGEAKKEAAEFLEQIQSRAFLEWMAGVLVVWVASHAFGVGFIFDIGMIGLGLYAIGSDCLMYVKLLRKSVLGAMEAKSESDLDAASAAFAEFLVKGGVDLLQAVLKMKTKKPIKDLGSTADSTKLGKAMQQIKARGNRNMPQLRTTRTSVKVAGGGTLIHNTSAGINIGIPGLKRQVSRMGDDAFVAQATLSLHKMKALHVSSGLVGETRVLFLAHLERTVARMTLQIPSLGGKKMEVVLSFPVSDGMIRIMRNTSKLGGVVIGHIHPMGERHSVVFHPIGQAFETASDFTEPNGNRP